MTQLALLACVLMGVACDQQAPNAVKNKMTLATKEKSSPTPCPFKQASKIEEDFCRGYSSFSRATPMDATELEAELANAEIKIVGMLDGYSVERFSCSGRWDVSSATRTRTGHYKIEQGKYCVSVSDERRSYCAEIYQLDRERFLRRIGWVDEGIYPIKITHRSGAKGCGKK